MAGYNKLQFNDAVKKNDPANTHIVMVDKVDIEPLGVITYKNGKRVGDEGERVTVMGKEDGKDVAFYIDSKFAKDIAPGKAFAFTLTDNIQEPYDYQEHSKVREIYGMSRAKPKALKL